MGSKTCGRTWCKRPAAPGRSSCAACLEIMRRDARKRRARIVKAPGECKNETCTRPAAPDRARCAGCLEVQRRASAARRAVFLKAPGQCSRCGIRAL